MTLTTAGFLGINEIAPNSHLHANGSFAHSLQFGGTALPTVDNKTIYMYDTGIAGNVLTIQTAHIVDGRIFIIKDETGNAGVNNITIATQGSETIDGQTSHVIGVNFGWVKLVARNGNLFIIG